MRPRHPLLRETAAFINLAAHSVILKRGKLSRVIDKAVLHRSKLGLDFLWLGILGRCVHLGMSFLHACLDSLQIDALKAPNTSILVVKTAGCPLRVLGYIVKALDIPVGVLKELIDVLAEHLLKVRVTPAPDSLFAPIPVLELINLLLL